MDLERRLDRAEVVWERLNGKRLILAGTDSRRKQIFMQNVTHISHQKGLDCVISDKIEDAETGSSFLLFAQMEGEQGFAVLGDLLDQLEAVKKREPSSVVLVSENGVYGKCFGDGHLRKETELGYLCHTAQEELPQQWMRTAEHLAWRLAKEEHVPIRIVRAGDCHSEKALQSMITAALCVLIYGSAGEVYNLPAEIEEKEADVSPLSPVPLHTDSAKVANLCNEEG